MTGWRPSEDGWKWRLWFAGPIGRQSWQNALGRFANLDWSLYWFRFISAETDSFSMGNVAFQ